ncbi:MAG: peptidase M10, partial [Chitinophagales bacterium]
GKGTPGIMYPRGTLVDPIFQYDPQAEPATKGGTIHPMYRRVSSKEIDLLRLDKFISHGKTYLGRFTSVYHNRHFKPVSA